MNQVQTDLIEALRRELPAVFSRQVAAQYLKGVFTAGGLAVMDSKGTGPGGVRIGRVVAYEKENFLRWLESRMENKTE